MNQNFMKEKPVMPLVISMALPMTFSMLVNALYNIIDSYFVARISEDAMTALSLVFPLQNLVNAVVIGFAIGINGPDCSWRANYNFVSCTGFLRGPYGWYWGTETRFCY